MLIASEIDVALPEPDQGQAHARIVERIVVVDGAAETVLRIVDLAELELGQAGHVMLKAHVGTGRDDIPGAARPDVDGHGRSAEAVQDLTRRRLRAGGNGLATDLVEIVGNRVAGRGFDLRAAPFDDPDVALELDLGGLEVAVEESVHRAVAAPEALPFDDDLVDGLSFGLARLRHRARGDECGYADCKQVCLHDNAPSGSRLNRRDYPRIASPCRGRRHVRGCARPSQWRIPPGVRAGVR